MNYVVSKATGVLCLARSGLEVSRARDLTAAYHRYDPAKRVGDASVDGRSQPGASWKHENVD